MQSWAVQCGARMPERITPDKLATYVDPGRIVVGTVAVVVQKGGLANMSLPFAPIRKVIEISYVETRE